MTSSAKGPASPRQSQGYIDLHPHQLQRSLTQTPNSFAATDANDEYIVNIAASEWEGVTRTLAGTGAGAGAGESRTQTSSPFAWDFRNENMGGIGTWSRNDSGRHTDKLGRKMSVKDLVNELPTVIPESAAEFMFSDEGDGSVLGQRIDNPLHDGRLPGGTPTPMSALHINTSPLMGPQHRRPSWAGSAAGPGAGSIGSGSDADGSAAGMHYHPRDSMGSNQFTVNASGAGAVRCTHGKNAGVLFGCQACAIVRSQLRRSVRRNSLK